MLSTICEPSQVRRPSKLSYPIIVVYIYMYIYMRFTLYTYKGRPPLVPIFGETAAA